MPESPAGYPRRSRDAQRRAEVQYAVSRVLAQASTVDEALDRLLPAIAEALGWDCASVWLVDLDGNRIECVYAWGLDEPPLLAFVRATAGLRFAPGQGLPRARVGHGRRRMAARRPERG